MYCIRSGFHRHHLPMALALGLALLLGGHAAVEAIEELFVALAAERLAEPKPAPSMRFPDIDGRTVDLMQDFRGKVVLLGFFTTA